jgi:hypothetical protein
MVHWSSSHMEDGATQEHRTNHGIKFVFGHRMALLVVSRMIDLAYNQLERISHDLLLGSCLRAPTPDAGVPFLSL